MNGIIYGLVDENDQVRYIGQTVRPVDRFRAHQRNAERGSDLRVHRWWRSMHPLEPKMIVLERLPVAELDAAEIGWIASLREAGANLTNHRSGGAKGIPDAESRQKMSIAQRSRPPVGPETRAKISAIHRGLKRSDVHKAKISASLKSSPQAKKQRADLAASQVGRKRSPEARARMAAAQARRYAAMSEDERKALTAAANKAWRKAA